MVTGICYPCSDLHQAAKVAALHNYSWTTVKVGKLAGQWYMVVINSREVK